MLLPVFLTHPRPKQVRGALDAMTHCGLSEPSCSVSRELRSQGGLVQTPALPLSSCVTIMSKLRNLSEPRSPQRKMIASPYVSPRLGERIK